VAFNRISFNSRLCSMYIPLRLQMSYDEFQNINKYLSNMQTIKWYACKFLNPNWHELGKQEKCSSLAPPRSKFYKSEWACAWQGVKLTRWMSIIASKKVWKFLIQIQLAKSNPKITRGVKVPCLMPISVKGRLGNEVFVFVSVRSIIGIYYNLS